MEKYRNFIYWAFDLLVLLLLGVMLLVHSLHLSPAWEQTLAVIVIVIVYGLVALWWRAHPAAMIEPDEDGQHLTGVQAHYQQIISINSRRK
jgi:protein-S-isoprenylcysteine O-methyltransferase Ste14